MTWRRLVLVSVLAALTASGAFRAAAAEGWMKLRSGQFEMYTSNSAQKAAVTLQNLEYISSLFSTMGWLKERRQQPIKIIAFQSEAEFAPYREGSAVAYYQHGRNCDYIVLQDLEGVHGRAAAHELTHAVLDRAGISLPLWLNEGLANLYSSLELTDGEWMVGRPVAGYVNVLSTEPWLDFETLTGVTANSFYYRQREALAIFYAESWSLTHMLAMSESYTGSFQKFVALVSSGMSTRQGFQDVYGKSENAVMRDMAKYLGRRVLPVSRMSVPLKKIKQPEIEEIRPVEIDLLLANLLASHKSGAHAARERFVELLRDYPRLAEVDESLAWLDLREGHPQDAWSHVRTALQKGSKDSDLTSLFAAAGDFSSLRKRRDICAIDLLRVPTGASSAGWCAD